MVILTMEKYKIRFGEKEIEFELQRKNVKNVNLSIQPDMRVVVTANEIVPIDFILNFTKKKAPWILKSIGYFNTAQSEVDENKEYVSGESIRYLGKQYRLKVQQSEIELVKYDRGFIFLNVKDTKNHRRKEKLLNEWLREKSKRNFEEALDRMYELVEKYKIEKPRLSIRTMKARWGSCLKDSNTILLNSELIKAPKFCIEYVILHELIHFLHRNHDREFYNFLSVLMPDWKRRKSILDEEVVRLL